MSADFAGIPMYPSEHIEVGRPLAGLNIGPEHGIAIFLHPLDLIAITYGADLHARADAALAWIVDRVERQARAAVQRLYDMHTETEGSSDV